MDKNDIEQKKKFLRFRKADEDLLKELQKVFEENADKTVAAFYDHLLKFEETRRLLSDKEVTERLMGLQKQYLISLASGEYEEEYFAARKRIGKTHDRIKLEPQYYLGTYGLYFSLLYPLVVEKYKDNPEKRQEAVLALMKIINLDSQIAMEAYIEAYHQKLEFTNKELERMNWQLEDLVEERTAQLKEFEHKLRQVERLALIGTVASGIAHEVGTPLNIISGRVEMLAQKAGTDERLQKDLNIINQQIERITKIIRELLSVSRPKEHAVTDIDVNELLSGVLQFLSVPIEKSRIEVSLNVDGCGRVIHGDKDQLQQVFLNLIMNALQSMGGDGKIDIRAACIEQDGSNYVCVEIADTGKGIVAENLEKIFDPFFSTKLHGEGTGLGLPIARDIVKKHSGYISVESEVGKGSTFSVLLPIPNPPSGKADKL